ncbi:hypothetical protein CFC21_064861 [Triticum aestivum]|uniref:Uncharacterized protein n=3 Tax=Triticum TaxID=4564 RepID=A0A9R0WKC9_TRITD|nr:hypothetical protein CFC21_064861 [Triticum aestivum]VAI14881.1 unnamed protein product [Triticum turgidum subsp. durum]
MKVGAVHQPWMGGLGEGRREERRLQRSRQDGGDNRGGSCSCWATKTGATHLAEAETRRSGSPVRGEKGDGRAAPGEAQAPGEKDERGAGDPGAGPAGPLEEEWMRETAVSIGRMRGRRGWPKVALGRRTRGIEERDDGCSVPGGERGKRGRERDREEREAAAGPRAI